MVAAIMPRMPVEHRSGYEGDRPRRERHHSECLPACGLDLARRRLYLVKMTERERMKFARDIYRRAVEAARREPNPVNWARLVRAGQYLLEATANADRKREQQSRIPPLVGPGKGA